MSKNYDGFGYFDLNVDNLGNKFHFISQHWDLPSPPEIASRQCHEIFCLSVGLGGYIFELKNVFIRRLAEHS